jgi:hypothetical protein
VSKTLCDAIMEGVGAFAGGKRGVLDGTVSSDKFQTNAKFQMSYGSLSLFYGGLESLLGPPKMLRGSLLNSMESEHCQERDAMTQFTTSNGVTSTSMEEWEVVTNPVTDKVKKEMYPERAGFREQHREWCRAFRTIDEMLELMEVEVNEKLRKEGHTELIREELIGGRLYTGPLYAKYSSGMDHTAPSLSGDPSGPPPLHGVVRATDRVDLCAVLMQVQRRAANPNPNPNPNPAVGTTPCCEPNRATRTSCSSVSSSRWATSTSRPSTQSTRV